MNKIKKVWMENKILLVLAIILLICLAVFIGVSITYFYGSNGDKYGPRLDASKELPLKDELFNDIKTELEKNESVSNVSTNLKGNIVYINITFGEGTDLEAAKKAVDVVPTLFNEDELAVYDLQFSIKSEGENGFILMGARNSNGSGLIVWNNNIVQEG